MISLQEIRKAVTEEIGQKFTTKINSNDIEEDLIRPSFFIALDNFKKGPAGMGINYRKLSVKITYFPKEMNSYTAEILEVVEKLEEVFNTKLRVGDRFFNIQETSGIIDDGGILRFSFDIQYEEEKDLTEAELMKNLYIEEE